MILILLKSMSMACIWFNLDRAVVGLLISYVISVIDSFNQSLNSKVVMPWYLSQKIRNLNSKKDYFQRSPVLQYSEISY